MPSTVHKRVATFSALKTGPRRSFSSLTCPCAHFSFVRVTALPSCGFPVRVTEMSVPPYVVSTFAFLGFLLVCVPLPWHWQARNAGTCLYMIWTGIGCLNVFINSIIWANDAVNYAPIWCDICESVSLISVESRSSTTLCSDPSHYRSRHWCSGDFALYQPPSVSHRRLHLCCAQDCSPEEAGHHHRSLYRYWASCSPNDHLLVFHSYSNFAFLLSTLYSLHDARPSFRYFPGDWLFPYAI
jgi:hypothetical protein